MNVTCLTATEPGRLIAGRLPYRHLHGKVGESLRQHWGEVDGFVVVLAVGATVRLLAPLLAGKERDPSVVCVDDAGRYAVVVCGGHAGGGNALAGQVAGLLGAEPVVTTATDNLGIPALDQLPGLVAEGDVAAVTAALLAGAPISCQADGGWPLPPALEDLVGGARLGAEADAREPRPAGSRPAARILVTDRLAPPARGHGTGVPPPSSAGSPSSAGLPVPTVRLRPPSLVVGIGTATD
ncbi:MAG: hypothetical protein ACRDWN_09530, partial [Acidimicrobiales bacterium]